MAVSYKEALRLIEAEDGAEVQAAFRTWKASEKNLAQYQVIKKRAGIKVVKDHRIANGITYRDPTPVKKER